MSGPLSSNNGTAGEDPAPKPGEKGNANALDISFALGTVTGELRTFRADFQGFKDDVRTDIKESVAGQNEKTKALEDRVVVLEKWHYRIAGAVGLAGALIGWAIQYIK